MRLFGWDEANRLVPLLDKTFEQVRPWVSRLREIHSELKDAEEHEASAEDAALSEEGERLTQRVREALAPLEEMGIEVKAADGLVDFRALRHGRIVYLCWRYGDESIGFWHELDAGFAGRRPIHHHTEFQPSY